MLICPHCERPMDEKHRRDGCKGRFTRRFFFGLLAGIGAAVALPNAVNDPVLLRPGDRISVSFSGNPSALRASIVYSPADRDDLILSTQLALPAYAMCGSFNVPVPEGGLKIRSAALNGQDIPFTVSRS